MTRAIQVSQHLNRIAHVIHLYTYTYTHTHTHTHTAKRNENKKSTAILIVMEGHKTAFYYGFWVLTLNYCEKNSMSEGCHKSSDDLQSSLKVVVVEYIYIYIYTYI